MPEGLRPNTPGADFDVLKSRFDEIWKDRPKMPESYRKIESLMMGRNTDPKFDAGVSPTDEQIDVEVVPFKAYFDEMRVFFQKHQIDETVPANIPGGFQHAWGRTFEEFRNKAAVGFARMMAEKYGISWDAEISSNPSVPDQAGTTYVPKRRNMPGSAHEIEATVVDRLEKNRYQATESPGYGISRGSGWYEVRVARRFLSTLEDI